MDNSLKRITKISLVAIITISALYAIPSKPVTYEKKPEPKILATSTEKLPEAISLVLEIPVQLKKIAWCESTNKQYKNGVLLRGVVNNKDVGKFQINEYYHLTDAIRLGMDLHTLEGNTEYALHLYRTQGSTPWNWSRDCWGNPNRIWWEDGGEYWSRN